MLLEVERQGILRLAWILLIDTRRRVKCSETETGTGTGRETDVALVVTAGNEESGKEAGVEAETETDREIEIEVEVEVEVEARKGSMHSVVLSKGKVIFEEKEKWRKPMLTGI